MLFWNKIIEVENVISLSINKINLHLHYTKKKNMAFHSFIYDTFVVSHGGLLSWYRFNILGLAWDTTMISFKSTYFRFF